MAHPTGAGLPLAANHAAPAAVEGVKGKVGANTVAQRSTSGARPALRRYARTVRTDLVGSASPEARAAVAVVIVKVDAGTAIRKSRWAPTACPLVAVRGRFGADVSAGAAVVRIRNHGRACPIADDSAIDTVVNARALNASAILVRTRCVTPGAASSAVAHVVGEIGAVIAATGLANGAAVIAAGPAVRVGPQIAARPAARYGGAADVFSAGAPQAGRVAATCLAGRQALVLLRLVGTPSAEGFARVLLGGPGGPQPQLAEYRAGEDRPHPPQRLAARHGSGQ